MDVPAPERYYSRMPGEVPKLGMFDAVHSELISRPHAYCDPAIERTPWHTRAMRVIDPFGNRLAFFVQT